MNTQLPHSRRWRDDIICGCYLLCTYSNLLRRIHLQFFLFLYTVIISFESTPVDFRICCED